MYLCFLVSKTCLPALKLQEPDKKASVPPAMRKLVLHIIWALLLHATSIPNSGLEGRGLQSVWSGNDKNNSSLLVLTAKVNAWFVVKPSALTLTSLFFFLTQAHLTPSNSSPLLLIPHQLQPVLPMLSLVWARHWSMGNLTVVTPLKDWLLGMEAWLTMLMFFQMT